MVQPQSPRPDLAADFFDAAREPQSQRAIEASSDPLSMASLALNRALVATAIACSPELTADVEAHHITLAARLSIPRHRAAVLTDIGLFLQSFPALSARISHGLLGISHLRCSRTPLMASVTRTSEGSKAM